MPGLCGVVQLHPQDRSAEQTLAAMLARCPAPEGEQVSTTALADGVAVQLSAFAHASPGATSWQQATVLLDGYVLDRQALVRRLQAVGAQIEPADEDGALLAALYVHEGPAALAEVDGDFNLCVIGYDPERLVLLSSRHGTRHLYYGATRDSFVFSPYLAALTAVIPAAVNRLAVGEMFNFGYLGGERSLLEGASLLPGAAMLRVGARDWSLQRCWQPRFNNDVATAESFDDLVDAAGTGLQAAVELFLRRFDKVTVPISGGLDSRAILAFAAQQRPDLRTCHCNWYEGEANIARQLVQAAGANWQAFDPLTFDFASILQEGVRQTEGNVHCHQFWFQPLARALAAQGQTDIVLDGYLMDVFFGDTFLVLPGASQVDASQVDASQVNASQVDRLRRNIINGLWRRCRPGFVKRAFLPGFYDDYEQANRDSLSQGMASVEEPDLSNFIHSFSFANRSNRYSVALPNAHRPYVEYGYPGLHKALVDLYLRIPPAYKTGARFSRTVLQRFAPDAARVPWAKTGRPLGRDKSLVDRMAERLSLRQVGSLALLRATGGRIDVSHRADLNRHFRRHAGFRAAHLDIVDDDRTFSRGWIDPAGLQCLTGMIDSGWPVFFLLQSLVTVELFHRRFID